MGSGDPDYSSLVGVRGENPISYTKEVFNLSVDLLDA